MRHDEFIGQVQDRARLPSRGDAERATRATLETLGERIPEGTADHLAAQLPHEIGEHLRRTEVYGGYGSGERFGRQEFLDRVASRAGVQRERAGFLARAVTSVLDEATQDTLTAKVTDALPDDIREIVAVGGEEDHRG